MSDEHMLRITHYIKLYFCFMNMECWSVMDSIYALNDVI